MWKLGLKTRTPERVDNVRVKGFVFDALGRNPDIGISVSEIVCRDPGCPGTETIILVMAPLRKTAACKVAKPMSDVTDDDVRDALKTLSYAP
ncbi:MAG: hypothetical protein ACRCTI_16970 [Beijerinckiaceae bacterium]